MDDTLANVEGAQGQLLKYLNSISSNRWLMMKIFFVLMVFLMIFIFFVAWFLLYHLSAHAMRRLLLCEVFFNFCSYYYTMYTIFTPDDKQPFTLLWSCKLGQLPHWSVALDSWVSMFPQYVWCIISGPNQTVIGDSNVSESLLIIVGSPLRVCVMYFLIVPVVSAASVSIILVILSQ